MTLRRILMISAASALALSLGACATVGPNFKTPAAPTQSGYAMAGDQTPAQAQLGAALAADWWTVFRSPEIDSVVKQAVAGNHSLASTRASLDQAREAVASQTGKASLDASGQVAADRVNLTSFGFSQFPLPDGSVLSLSNPTFSLYTFGVSGRYDLDLFGRHAREHEQLLAQAQAEELQTQTAYLTLTAQVVGQAIDIAALRGQIAAAEDIVASDRQNLDVANKAYRLGGGTRLDVATIQTEMAGDEGQIIPLRQQLAVARHALALLVGQAPADWTPPDFDLDKIAGPEVLPVTLPSDLVHARPDIQAAEARLHAATARIGMTKADLYPSISLTGNIAQSGLHPLDLFSYDATGFLVGPEIRLPLLNRGELKAKERGAEAAARGAQEDYQQTVLSAFVQVADSLQALANDEQAIANAQQALDAATDGLRLQRLRHEDGKTGLLPVLDSQRSYARARIALVRAKAQRLRDSAALLYAVGRPWQDATTAPSIASAAQSPSS